MRIFKAFTGGYKFKRYEGQPSPVLVEDKLPPSVIIPLRQGFGTEVKPLVKKGDAVFAGQIIGRDDASISSPVHASVNGVVEDIRKVNYFKRDITTVVIRRTDDSRDISKLPGHSAEWGKLNNADIEKLVYLSGVSSLDREGIPTHFKSSIISPDDVKHLIIHATESEPYNISLEVLLEKKRLLYFFEGLKMLKRILPKCKVHLAVNVHKKKIIEQLVKLTAGLEWVDIYPVEPKYPQGYDEMLIPTILKQKFPYGYSAANIGVVVLNAQAVVGVYEAVAFGIPLIERVVALCGPSMEDKVHIKVRVGTPLDHLLPSRLKETGASRVVLNSLLTGFNLNDLTLPIDRTFSQIIAIPEAKNRKFLAFMDPGIKSDSITRAFLARWIPFSHKKPDTNIHGDERPCISCGFCEEVCPVRIIPHLLSKYVKREIIDETLMNYNIFNCIECGLCTFVCPVKIPLLKHIKEGHDKLV
ncbi:MAG: 4Fe-4S dicluster domain-containing protein, partial [Candidatus Omnitrophota bacterium]|nr:4Fe-4S dicluster domain-containing protein [Candidatus Omnitrophota bacterium]